MTGKTLWISNDFNSTILELSTSLNGSQIYLCGSSNIAAFNGLDNMLNITAPRMLWSYTVPDQVGFHSSALNSIAIDENDNILVLGTTTLYSISVSGQLVWKIPLNVEGWHPLSLAIGIEHSIQSS